jgi:hypothetical protein
MSVALTINVGSSITVQARAPKIVAVGVSGPAGPANSLAIGTVTTVAAGGSATASVTGSSPSQTLNLGIPTGATGSTATVSVGSTTTGAAGTSAAVSNSGTSSAAVLNFTVPRGDSGTAATIAVHSTTTGAAGTSASVVNVGTTSAASLDFTIPQGAKGDTGTAATISTATPTVITGAAGTDASVVNTGTSSAAVYQFTIPRGNTGNTGADGKTVRNGSGAPSSGLGVDGDFYLDTTASRIYGPKTSGAWDSGVSLVGATGADGKTVRNGSGAPSSGLGVDGDFYLNTATNTISGPKTSGAWPAAVSLVGATGADGKTVRNGTTTPSAGLGVDGDFYLNTATNTISGPKASGAWPAAVSLVGPKGDTGATGDWSTAQTLNPQTGTTYPLVAGDVGKLVTLTNASAITVTVPTGIAAVGQRIDLAQLGTGQVTVSGGSGVTINSTPTAKLRTQYSAATLICTATTTGPTTATFLLVGDLAAV